MFFASIAPSPVVGSSRRVPLHNDGAISSVTVDRAKSLEQREDLSPSAIRRLIVKLQSRRDGSIAELGVLLENINHLDSRIANWEGKLREMSETDIEVKQKARGE